MFSRYVQTVNKNGVPYLYHTIFYTFIKQDSSEQELRDGFFLQGQEQEALKHKLLTRENKLKLFYISTWECSLRCPFCFVYKQLQKRDNVKTDPHKYLDFLERYWDQYPETPSLTIGYLGGEPLMSIDNCLLVQEVSSDFAKRKGIDFKETVTTNGTIPIGIKEKKFLDNLYHISVSVDGDYQSHNQQRKVYTKDLFVINNELLTPYEKTLKTLKDMVDFGYADKLTINSALPDEVHNDKARLREHILMMLALGVKPESIHMGTIVPTDKKKDESQHYQNYLRSGFVFPRPCCVFQYMSFFTLHGNDLCANYFEAKSSSLGVLTSSLDELAAKYRKHIEETMPILQDDVCVNKCNVVGYCWGGCNNSMATRVNPSSRCDRELLQLKLKESIENDRIESFLCDYEPTYTKKKLNNIISIY